MAGNMTEKTLLLFALFLISFPPSFLFVFPQHENNDLHLFFYPEAEKTHILENNNNFCKNGGVLKSLEAKKECMCRGTGYFGSRCHIDCKTLGYIIPEKCLQGKNCTIPSSCIDVSRKPKIHIDRCQNGGVLLIGKTKQLCNCYSTGFWGLYCTRPCLSRQPSWCKKNNCSNLYPAECLF